MTEPRACHVKLGIRLDRNAKIYQNFQDIYWNLEYTNTNNVIKSHLKVEVTHLSTLRAVRFRTEQMTESDSE